MMRAIRVRLRREDEGAMLVLVLMFVTVVGLLSGSVLSMIDTGARASHSYVDAGESRYAADGAIDAAIQVLRGDVDAGRDPAAAGSCPDSNPLATFAVNGVTAEVTCEGEPGSGEPQLGGGEGEVVPEHAILAMGHHAQEGIVRTGLAAATLSGSMFSHSKIDSSAVLTTAGKVYAVGACSATVITLQPPLQCNLGAAGHDDPLGADPDYEPLAPFQPPTKTVPDPTGPLGLPVCTGSTFVLQPGRYQDARALTRLTTDCPGATIHLAPAANGPGVFVFDFLQVGPTDEPEDHIWKIDRTGVRVVGGTPKNWLAGHPTLLPGACKIAGDAAPNHGVQLIFAGNSRLDLVNGAMEVCAQPTDDEQNIAIFGVPPRPAYAVVAHGTGATGQGFVSPALAEGPTDDTWTSATGSGQAHVDVGFAASIPANATLTSVVVRVRHREAPGTAPQLVVTPGDGSPACAPASFDASTVAWAVDSANVSSCITNAAKLTGMRARFVSSTGTIGWAKVDSFTLELGFGGTAVPPLSGCTQAEPYVSLPANGSSPCAVVHTSGSSTFAVQGTIYAPTAPIHLELGLASIQTVAGGIVARTVRFDASIGIAVPGRPSGTPVVVTRADRIVEIVASLDGEPAARALVRFGDQGGTAPGATVDVLDFNYL